MARKPEWPDPNDRSRNNPCTQRNREVVLALYQQGTGNDAKYVSESVKVWFEEEAKKRGWDEIIWTNGATGTTVGCTLCVKFET